MKSRIILFAFFLTLTTPTSPGPVMNNKLPPCLNTPNCVSSQAKIADKQHYIAPFEIKGDVKTTWVALKEAILKKSRMLITHETHNSLHAEATSLLFHFVDDIDMILDAEAQLIHVRSASRTGHSDFGVNRKRIEELRMSLQKAQLIE